MNLFARVTEGNREIVEMHVSTFNGNRISSRRARSITRTALVARDSFVRSVASSADSASEFAQSLS